MRNYHVTIRDGDRFYLAALTVGQARYHDNGCLSSIGLTVGRDLLRRTLRRWINQGIVRVITHKEWNR